MGTERECRQAKRRASSTMASVRMKIKEHEKNKDNYIKETIEKQYS